MDNLKNAIKDLESFNDKIKDLIVECEKILNDGEIISPCHNGHPNGEFGCSLCP
tara:strand:+ start:1916 stop:2077 length:162 start_codon:yes stop_codon:yes gene_type:complete